MRFSTLNEWLEWQQNLHWQEIELGLDRIKKVAEHLQLTSVAPYIIIVAGTNGKGSTVTYYSEFLRSSGVKVGSYTSPHLQHYNERITINGVHASDDKIMQAFHQIDEARGEISLSYFEFGTLAALLCIRDAKVDVAVLEVGLGGRLDAVNIMDADLVHFTPIGIDHTAWLGDTREKIAIEKAGVLRKNCQVICNDPNPPASLLEAIKQHTSHALLIEKDYQFDEKTDHFSLNNLNMDLSKLALVGQHQKLNCCGVLAGLSVMNNGQYFDQKKILNKLQSIRFKGRFETINETNAVKTIVDVGHNVEAAKVLSQQVMKEQPKHCVMILGMLEDKNVTDFCDELSTVVEHCICISLFGDRALSADALSVKIQSTNMTKEVAVDMKQAIIKAQCYLNDKNDLMDNMAQPMMILVTGSFYTVEEYLSQI